MKSPGAIRHKIKQVRYRHLKRRLEDGLRRCPTNCRFNGKVDIPGVPEGLHVCLYGMEMAERTTLRACDDRHGGLQQAKDCPWFDNAKDKGQIKAEFQAELESMSIAEIAYEYPDMAALVWVLGAEDVPTTGEDVDEDFEPQVAQHASTSLTEMASIMPPPKVPWWVRFLGGGST